jgi:hypothetical protein
MQQPLLISLLLSLPLYYLLRDSLKFGFLSQQADPHIAKLLKTEKQLLIAAIILAAVGMIAEKFT